MIKNNFNLDQQIKIWLHYVTLICYLNTVLEIKGNPYNKHRIKSFDDFISENNDMKSECLVGHYWRFKDDITLI